jgi:hypothetical protein
MMINKVDEASFVHTNWTLLDLMYDSLYANDMASFLLMVALEPIQMPYHTNLL